jgi:RNA polymerase sigma-70 factor, ECF subfamily
MTPDATSIAMSLDAGAPASTASDLAPLVYDDLRRVAAALMAREPAGITLQPTALVHEAFLRMVDQSRVQWRGRAHFLAIGARMVRRVLIDTARARRADKRGGGIAHVTLADVPALTDRSSLDLEALDAALRDLAAADARAAQVVELRFFGGLTEEQIALVLGVTDRTVRNDWRAARAWLQRVLEGDRP